VEGEERGKSGSKGPMFGMEAGQTPEERTLDGKEAHVERQLETSAIPRKREEAHPDLLKREPWMWQGLLASLLDSHTDFVCTLGCKLGECGVQDRPLEGSTPKEAVHNLPYSLEPPESSPASASVPGNRSSEEPARSRCHKPEAQPSGQEEMNLLEESEKLAPLKTYKKCIGMSRGRF
jgi:hypothetical protein